MRLPSGAGGITSVVSPVNIKQSAGVELQTLNHSSQVHLTIYWSGRHFLTKIVLKNAVLSGLH